MSAEDVRAAEINAETQAPNAHEQTPSSGVLGFIDQTLYANADSGPDVVWANHEVLELLREIRMQIVVQSTPSLMRLAPA